MRAGHLRHKIRVMRKENTQDDYGGHATALVDVVELFAEVKPLSARERLEYDQPTMKITHRVTTRPIRNPPDNGAYWGRRYFGGRYWGKRYFGSTGGTGPQLTFNPDYVIVFGQKSLEIRSIDEVDERGFKTVLLCEEIKD